MKTKLLLALIVLFFTLQSCNNDDTKPEFESTAIISGYDMTLCVCCGGWIISIDKQEFNKRFSELPQDSDIDLNNSTFPISVKLNWSESSDYCGKGITIESIELIE